MSAIDDFAKTLTSTGHDDLVTVLQAMSDGMYRSRSEEIEGQLAEVVAKIDQVNDRREQLSGQRALLDRLLRKIDSYMTGHETDLELQLFRLHLSNQLDKLKVRIAETRPDEELKIKHDLTQERLLLEAGRKIAIEVMRRIAKTENVG
jgi:hypothetical protein